MANQMLSQSPIRDPFSQAQSQYESRQTISQSPMQPQGSPLGQTQVQGNTQLEGIQFNELGKMQLIQKLKEKYGEMFQQNPEAMKALSDFDMQMNSPENTKIINQGLANANRTLGALFGGG